MISQSRDVWFVWRILKNKAREWLVSNDKRHKFESIGGWSIGWFTFMAFGIIELFFFFSWISRRILFGGVQEFIYTYINILYIYIHIRICIHDDEFVIFTFYCNFTWSISDRYDISNNKEKRQAEFCWCSFTLKPSLLELENQVRLPFDIKIFYIVYLHICISYIVI